MDTWCDSTVGRRGRRGDNCGDPTGEQGRAGWMQCPSVSGLLPTTGAPEDRSCRDSLRPERWDREASRGWSLARLRSPAWFGSHSVTTMKDSMPRRRLSDERPCRASQGFGPSWLPSWGVARSLLGWLETHDDIVRGVTSSATLGLYPGPWATCREAAEGGGSEAGPGSPQLSSIWPSPRRVPASEHPPWDAEAEGWKLKPNLDNQ